MVVNMYFFFFNLKSRFNDDSKCSGKVIQIYRV